jgi:hypothetical protein
MITPGCNGSCPWRTRKSERLFVIQCVILCADGGHELPVFRTAETEIVDMIGYLTGSMRQFNQRSV